MHLQNPRINANSDVRILDCVKLDVDGCTKIPSKSIDRTINELKKLRREVWPN